MTTIIVDRDRGIAVADSKFSEDGISFPTPKLFRIGTSVFGEAGETRGLGKFFAWINAGQPDDERPQFSGQLDDFCAVELSAAGVFYWDRHLYPVPVVGRYYAIGTGGPLAMLCAKEFDYPVERAVRLACRYDPDSQLPIQVMRLRRTKE